MDIVIFRKVFSNKVLNQIIFKKVHYIFIDVLKQEKTYNWNEVYQSTKLLAGNDYFDLLKKYYKRNNITKLYSKDAPVAQIIQKKRLDILKYLIEELGCNHQTKFNAKSHIRIYGDMLSIATLFGSLEIIKYLESLVRVSDSTSKDYDGWDYNQAMAISPHSNDIEIVKYLNSKIDLNTKSGVMTYRMLYTCVGLTLQLGRIDMFEYLTNHHVEIGSGFIGQCIDSGKLEILQYYLSTAERRESVSDDEVIYRAMMNNQFDMVQWLHENNIGTSSPSAMDQACRFSLDVVKWFHENRTEGCTHMAMDFAARNGHLDIIEWLHANRTEGCSTEAMDNAASEGHFEVLKWLHDNRTEGCTTYAMNGALNEGHFEIFKWLHANRTEGCTSDAMDSAAGNGQLETIQWMHENRTEGCSTYAMESAAFNEHIEVFKWLHENRTEGCSDSTFRSAASNGNLELLKYMYSNGMVDRTDYTSSAAASNGQLHVIKWMHENDVCDFSTAAMDDAAENGQLEVIKWLHENRTEGCSEYIMEWVVEYGHLDVLQWLFENNYEQYFHKEDIQKIKSTEKNMETIRWLKDNKLID